LKINHNHSLRASSFVCVFLAAGLIFAQNAFAGSEHNVGGFAWSGSNSAAANDGQSIGWVSFNNVKVDGVGPATPGPIDYGVNIDGSNGEMSGYAWSAADKDAGNNIEGLGWISFQKADVKNCPDHPGDNTGDLCVAKVKTELVDNKYTVSGWARVLSVKNETSNNGGWEGWIKLSGTAQDGSPYGVYIDSNGDFHGYAWSDMVIGWLSFNSLNCAGPGCAPGSPYKVHTSVSFGPKAIMECGGTCSGGYCDTDPNSTWIMYPPIGDCAANNCRYEVHNMSTGNVQCTKWELVGTAYSYAASGKADHLFQPSVPLGTYQLKLTVSDEPYSVADNPDCAKGKTSSVQHTLQIKREAIASFVCSFDDPTPTMENPTPNPVWQNCEDTSFKNKVLKGEKIFLKETSSENTGWSQDASQINSFDWTITIDGAASTMTGQVASFNAGKSNTIELTVTDNAGRSNCKIVNLGSRTLPKWQEVSPVGMIWQYLTAAVSKIFATI
jgi:hypothetical protein